MTVLMTPFGATRRTVAVAGVGDQVAAVAGQRHLARGVRAGRRSPGRRRRRIRGWCRRRSRSTPVRSTRRMRLLPESAIRKEPSGVGVSPRGVSSWAAIARPPSPESPRVLPATVMMVPSGAILPDAVVAGVGDEHAAVRERRDRGRGVEVRGRRRAAVAREARGDGARDRGDDPVRAPPAGPRCCGCRRSSVEPSAAIATPCEPSSWASTAGPPSPAKPGTVPATVVIVPSAACATGIRTASAAMAGMSRRVRKDMRGSVARSPPAVCRACDAPRVRPVTSLLSPGACVTSTAHGPCCWRASPRSPPSWASSSWAPERWTGSSAAPSTRATRRAAARTPPSERDRGRRRRPQHGRPQDALALRPQRPGAAHRPPGRRRARR